MARRSNTWILTATALGMLSLPWVVSYAEEKPAEPVAEKQPAAPTKRPDPAPLADHTKKGLKYLVDQQNKDGGWGQGGGWRTGQGGRVEGAEVKDPSDVGNTCVAVLALLRSGSLPTEGDYATQVNKGVEFICANVEKSDRQSIWVTDVRDTQLQSKIGQYVDTFLAALVLSELKGRVPADKGGSRIEESLKKVIAKIESNQKEDGTFEGNGGWASVLSQGLCSKALNRAAQNGVAVRPEVLRRDFKQAEGQLAAAGAVKGDPATAAPEIATEVAEPVAKPADGKEGERVAKVEEKTSRAYSGRVSAKGGAGDAGVKLYNFSANAGRVSDLKNSQDQQRKKVQQIIESKTASKEEKAQAGEQLQEFDRVAATHREATDEIIKQMDNEQFIAGFGNNGGEEFLSHMNISETMFAEGGKDWERWNKSISSVIGKVQNGDGSWSGHHCITGRTFCTGAALLTLMADRAPVPVAEKLSSK